MVGAGPGRGGGRVLTRPLRRLARAAALALAASLPATALLAAPARAATDEFRHGLSAFGDLAYPADFAHFAWVNPEAPKGGTFSTDWLGSFDSLHVHVRKGEPAWPDALPLLHDTLMVRAGDEPDAMYGLLAAGARVAADGAWVEFRLRPEARFADGSPVTVDDVLFSFAALRDEGLPTWRQRFAGVAKAERVAPDVVRFSFRPEAPQRDLPLQVATLPVLQEAWWAGRDFGDSTLDAPVGSGPYRVAEVDPGHRIVFARRPDYWARDLPVNRGRFNFDRLVAEYFRDDTAAFEAFKTGIYRFREEFIARVWVTQYTTEDVEAGRIVRDVVPDLRPGGTQGFFFNTRRPVLADLRVRQAIALVLDFEWTNRTLFHDQYLRTDSWFEGSPLEATGEAGPAERALLATVGAAVPEAQLRAPHVPPVTDGSGRIRRQLRAAGRLLDAAGWPVGADGWRRHGESGAPLAVEFLLDSSGMERIAGPFAVNLRQLGIDATLRVVDRTQAEERRKSFDFDLIAERFVLPVTPGADIRAFFHSASADQEGSFNLAGIRDPAIDRLLDAVGAAATREAHAVAVRALDRALRAGQYWVPHWNLPAHRIAFWDVFGRPAEKAPFHPGFLDTWWALPEPRPEVQARLPRGS